MVIPCSTRSQTATARRCKPHPPNSPTHPRACKPISTTAAAAAAAASTTMTASARPRCNAAGTVVLVIKDEPNCNYGNRYTCDLAVQIQSYLDTPVDMKVRARA